MKCKILSDKATQLLFSISNQHVESAKLPLVNLTSEDLCSRSSVLSEENVVFKTHILWALKKCKLYETIPGGKYIQSSVEISALDVNRLRFILYPNVNNSDEQSKPGSLNFSVHFNNLPQNIYIVCEVALVAEFRNVILEKAFSAYSHNLQDNKIIFPNFCPLAKIYYDNMEEKLTIQCNIKILSRIYTCVTEKLTYVVKKATDVSDFNNDILKNGKYSDVTLVVKTNKQKCHKFILATESPSLHILMKVNHRNELELDKKINMPILRKLLTYMYTRKFCILSFYDAVEFYKVSYDCDVLSLKDICTTYLIASLTETNVPYVWDLSRSYKDEYLLNACIAFVKAHVVDPDGAFQAKWSRDPLY